MIIVILKAGSFFKLVQVLVLSGVKFLLAPPYAIGIGFNYIQTFLITTIGGLLGVIFFFYLSEFLLKVFKKVWPVMKGFFASPTEQSSIETTKIISETDRKKSFTRKNKFIIAARKKYGLWGIAILTPILLSIPLGTFLASKYYKNKRSVLISLAVSVIGWSLIMSSVYAIFKLKPF